MQGFFGKPVDDLHAEPIIARWIRSNIKNWQMAVIVSKSAGGSKRVTSLADALKLSFAIITTDRARNVGGNTILESSTLLQNLIAINNSTTPVGQLQPESYSRPVEEPQNTDKESNKPPSRSSLRANGRVAGGSPALQSLSSQLKLDGPKSSPLNQALVADNEEDDDSESSIPKTRLHRSQTAPSPLRSLDADYTDYTDEKAREVITGRLIQGHIVDDDFPSPMLSIMSSSVAALPPDQIGPSGYEDHRDPMTASFMSTVSSLQHDIAMGGTYDGAVLSEEEEEEKLKDPELEHTVTLVGNVRDKTAILIDDIMDRSESWIAAAETVVKRGGATKVYCIATHGLFGGNALSDLDRCDCIDHIVVTDTFPIELESQRSSKKLIVLPLAGLLAEAIRRNQYGESISHIYQYYQD
jgi:ribose-phosphate pyrophosphokinase